jgi:superfamily II DNA or RNA helicase
MTLRDYQALGKQLISACFQRLIYYVILCVPTGGGKTVMFADMTKDCLAAGWPVLILCNRVELIDQANKKLNEFGVFPTLIVPGYIDHYSNLYLASIDTLVNRRLPDVKVVIIDEAHLRDFDEIALEYKRRGAIVIGCTATPDRTGKAFLKDYPDYTGQLCDIYEEIVTPTTITKLIGEGYLVPAVCYGPEFDPGDLKTTETDFGVDYKESDLYKVFDKPGLYAGTVDNYLKLAKGKKALCFNINVKHSKKQTAEFNSRGIPAIHVDGKTPKKIRKKIFEDFAAGRYMVLCNCGIATTGYDEPTIECVIINRVTMSLTLFLQMMGRGGRICDEIGKQYFIGIDQGGNIWRLGRWEDEREWNLDPVRVTRTIGVAPIKECEHCKALIPVSSMICQYCNHGQTKAVQEEKKLLTGEFTLIESGNIPKELKKEVYKMTIPELEKYREIKEYKLGWVVRQLWSRGDEAIKEYAKLKGYTDGWTRRQLAEAQENRVKVKAEIWAFIKDNSHLEANVIEEHAYKKLKASHKQSEINILMPKILENAELYKKDPAQFA